MAWLHWTGEFRSAGRIGGDDDTLLYDGPSPGTVELKGNRATGDVGRFDLQPSYLTDGLILAEKAVGSGSDIVVLPFLQPQRPPLPVISAVTASSGADITVALPGEVITADKVVALDGFLLNTAQGVLGVGSGTFVDLTGQAATTAQGQLSVTIDKAFTGLAATGTRGLLTPNLDKALTGLAATTAQGVLTPNLAIPLVGLVITGAQGTMTPSVVINANLTGQAATGTGGVMTPNLAIPLTGLATTAIKGDMTPSAGTGASVTPTGQAATCTGGQLTPVILVPLTGLLASGAQGVLTPSPILDVALTGLSASALQGQLSVFLEQQGAIQLTGLRAITRFGEFYIGIKARIELYYTEQNSDITVTEALTDLYMTAPDDSLRKTDGDDSLSVRTEPDEVVA